MTGSTAVGAAISTRSIGVKLLVVCGLAVSMTIPGFYVGSLVEERTKRADEVVRQISGYSGGQQTFLGPTLIVPYSDRSPSNIDPTDVYVIFPAAASAVLKTATEERKRSLFKVPVFRADLAFDATFDLTGIPATPVPGRHLDWDHAQIVVGATDLRGALDEVTLTANGKTTAPIPSQAVPNIAFGADGYGHVKLALLGATIGADLKPDTRFQATSSMRFSGAQRIAVLSYGNSTHVTAQGDWRNPGFDGGFLPNRRKITSSGYSAEWSIPFIARGVPAAGPINSITGLVSTELGTSFIEVADPYQSVNRCLKYALLFLGLIFLSYFVLEVVTGKRIHPAQYILVGVAQIIFYLLLLSLAERIGFDWAFVIGGASTVALLSTNAGWVFDSRLQGLRALVTFTVLYSMIFVLLRAEDYALLIGAITSFIVVAVAMYLTRKIDWYSPLSDDDELDGRITPRGPGFTDPAPPRSHFTS